MPRFHILGNLEGDNGWSGPVAVSGSRIYFLRKFLHATADGFQELAAPATGNLGMALGGQLSRALNGAPKVQLITVPITKLSALPADLTGHADWPWKNESDLGITIFQREDVRIIRKPFASPLRISIGAVDYKIWSAPFAWGKTLRPFLESHRWPLE